MSDYSFYTIIPQGWLFGTSSDDRKCPYIIDSGTSFAYIPNGTSSVRVPSDTGARTTYPY